MKKIIFLLLFLGIVTGTMGQLKGKSECAEITVDLMTGRVNGIKPNVPFIEIKQLLPCFSSAVEESDSAKCGGGLFYKDKDVSFYTRRDYVEIGEKFKGKLTVPILGAARNTMFNRFGHAKVRDDTWDAFQMQYGTLVLYYNTANKVKKIRFSTLNTDVLSLCD